MLKIFKDHPISKSRSSRVLESQELWYVKTVRACYHCQVTMLIYHHIEWLRFFRRSHLYKLFELINSTVLTFWPKHDYRKNVEEKEQEWNKGYVRYSKQRRHNSSSQHSTKSSLNQQVHSRKKVKLDPAKESISSSPADNPATVSLRQVRWYTFEIAEGIHGTIEMVPSLCPSVCN